MKSRRRIGEVDAMFQEIQCGFASVPLKVHEPYYMHLCAYMQGLEVRMLRFAVVGLTSRLSSGGRSSIFRGGRLLQSVVSLRDPRGPVLRTFCLTIQS